MLARGEYELRSNRIGIGRAALELDSQPVVSGICVVPIQIRRSLNASGDECTPLRDDQPLVYDVLTLIGSEAYVSYAIHRCGHIHHQVLLMSGYLHLNQEGGELIILFHQTLVMNLK